MCWGDDAVARMWRHSSALHTPIYNPGPERGPQENWHSKIVLVPVALWWEVVALPQQTCISVEVKDTRGPAPQLCSLKHLPHI